MDKESIISLIEQALKYAKKSLDELAEERQSASYAEEERLDRQEMYLYGKIDVLEALHDLAK